MQAKRHEEGVEHRDKDGEHDRSRVIEPSKSVADSVSNPDSDRAQEERRERDHDDHGEEGNEHELDVFGDDLSEAVIHGREYRRHDERHEHLTAVILKLHGNPEDIHLTQLSPEAIRCARCSWKAAHAHKVGSHERGHDCRTEPSVNVEFLGRVVGNHDRKEIEDRTPCSIQECPERRLGFRAEVLNTERVHHSCKCDDERSA